MTTKPTDAAAQTAALILGDAATLAPTPPMAEPADGENILAVKAAIMDKFSVFGRQAARGQASLTHVALTFAAAVREKILTEDDAEPVYRAYAGALNDMVDGKLAATGLARLD